MNTHLIDSPRLSMSEGARRVGVSTATFWRWALRGVRGRRLPTILVGGRRWVLLTDVEAFLVGGLAPSPQIAPQVDLSNRVDSADAELSRRGI